MDGKATRGASGPGRTGRPRLGRMGPGLAALLLAAVATAPQGASAKTLFFTGGYHKAQASTGDDGGNGVPDPTKLDASDLVDPVYSTDSHGCMSGTVGVPMSFPIQVEVDPGAKLAFYTSFYGSDPGGVPGLTMSDDGVVSGTPTTAAAGAFIYTAAKGYATSFTGYQCYQIGNPKGSPGSGALSFEDGYDQWVVPGQFVDIPPPRLDNPTGRVAWTISTSLPAGLSFVEGEIFGVVAAEGETSYALTARDSTGAEATTKTMKITSKALGKESSLLTDGTCIDIAHHTPVDWHGYVWRNKPEEALKYSATNPPEGLTVDGGSGRVYGVPKDDDQNKGVFSFEVEARWVTAEGVNASRSVWICLNQDHVYPDLEVEPPGTSNFATGETVSVSAPKVYGGDGSGASFDIDPPPPPGLTFSGGTISGKMRYAYDYGYTLIATDGSGNRATATGMVKVYDANVSMSYDGTCLGGSSDAPAQSGQDLSFFPWVIHNPLGGVTSWEITGVSNDLLSFNYGVDERKWLRLDASSGLVTMTVPTAASGDGLAAEEGTYSGTMTMTTTITDATGVHSFTNPFCFHLKVNNKYSGSGGIRG